MNNIMIEQIKGLLTEENMIAALANVSSCIMLNYKNLNWSGFYFKTDKDLVLGPFREFRSCQNIESLNRSLNTTFFYCFFVKFCVFVYRIFSYSVL